MERCNEETSLFDEFSHGDRNNGKLLLDFDYTDGILREIYRQDIIKFWSFLRVIINLPSSSFREDLIYETLRRFDWGLLCCDAPRTVTEIEVKKGWCYVSCSNWPKKLQHTVSSFTCLPCKNTNAVGALRYVLMSGNLFIYIEPLFAQAGDGVNLEETQAPLFVSDMGSDVNNEDDNPDAITVPSKVEAGGSCQAQVASEKDDHTSRCSQVYSNEVESTGFVCLHRTIVLEMVFVYRKSNEVESTGLEKNMMRRKMKAWKKKESDLERYHGHFAEGGFREVIDVV
ncbi:hypothetical protein Bca4012_020564 [Brassica carinata]